MSTDTRPADDNPLDDFTDCHAGIIDRLTALDELPALAAAAAHARELAGRLLDFFDEVVEQHHTDEEQELIPAVLAAAEPGEEAERAELLANRIIAEHRALELMWGRIRPHVKRIAKAQQAELDGSDVAELVADYKGHAAFEETEFLPLAQRILARKSNDLAALGMSLHIRRTVDRVVPYV